MRGSSLTPLVLVWSCERALELGLVTLFVMLVFHPSEDVGDPGSEFLRTAVFGISFYVVSGYLWSCVKFGFFSRSRDVRKQIMKMTAAFCLNLLIFVGVLFVVGRVAVLMPFILSVACAALPAVALANGIGTWLFNRMMEVS